MELIVLFRSSLSNCFITSKFDCSSRDRMLSTVWSAEVEDDATVWGSKTHPHQSASGTLNPNKNNGQDYQIHAYKFCNRKNSTFLLQIVMSHNSRFFMLLAVNISFF